MTAHAQRQQRAESIPPVAAAAVYHWSSDGDGKSSRQVKVQESPDGRKSQRFHSVRARLGPTLQRLEGILDNQRHP